jgi:hypothetical protein
MKLLGLPVATKLFKVWSNILVYPVSPFFLTDELKPRVPSLHLTRSEFRATFQDLSFQDAYTTYAVSSEVAWVTFLSNHHLKSFPGELQLELLHLQAQLGRGQIYNFDDYKNLLKEKELEQALESTFKFEGKEMLELNHTLWHSFSFETQQRWLAKFISEDRNNCLSGTLSKRQWHPINEHYPAIKHLVGFADRSGVNCFATTLAATLEVEQARGVSRLWLQTETFLRTVEECGYKKTVFGSNETLATGSILI